MLFRSMVLGEGKPFISALLVLNPDAWKILATELGLDAKDSGSLQSPAAVAAVLQKLADLLNTFPGYSQIHAVYLSCDFWSRIKPIRQVMPVLNNRCNTVLMC